jgi:hypothetical protein
MGTGPPLNAGRGFAIPARLHVFLGFMTQFMVILGVLGGVVPTLHKQGVNSVLLGVGAAAALIIIQLIIGGIGRLIPVRCKACRSRSHFLGFGWWPFKYRYGCRQCGLEMRFEVG